MPAGEVQNAPAARALRPLRAKWSGPLCEINLRCMPSGTSGATKWFSQTEPSAVHHEGSRDPARTSLCATQSGGVLVCETNPPESFGRIGTEGFTRNRLEHSPARRHYFMLRLFLQTLREVNDETRSHHNHNCGHFGSYRLGGGGECAIWRSGPSQRPCASLRPCTSQRPCASLSPFSKICPSSLPSLCSSDRSELWRSPCGLYR